MIATLKASIETVRQPNLQLNLEPKMVESHNKSL